MTADAPDFRRQEAETLARIGTVFRAAQLPPLRVSLPRDLAAQAVAAWERDDQDEIADPEHPADRRARHHAGTLALIGLAITDQGLADQCLADQVGADLLVDLDPELIGVAMDSTNDLE